MTTGIATASLALADLVRAAVPRADVRIGPPAAATGNDLSVALWLYRVDPDANARNVRRVGPADPTQPGLFLTAHYLLSVTGPDQADAHHALGALALAINDHPVLATGEGDACIAAAPPLAIEPLPIETVTALWSTLGPVPLHPWLALSVGGIRLHAPQGAAPPLPIVRD
ncbi:Pvc16 family protein [Sphingomonas sp. FW199]|uniref:Pvc16 family protein n=1 Tax=Sphingomonas sp. FW199 TaxID=3400217 RepID=UPI003CE9BCA7